MHLDGGSLYICQIPNVFSLTVLALMGDNPFPDEPPKFVRAVLYKYHYTKLLESKTSPEHWWKRDFAGDYLFTLDADSEQLNGFLKYHNLKPLVSSA